MAIAFTSSTRFPSLARSDAREQIPTLFKLNRQMSVHEARSCLQHVLAALTRSKKRELFNAYQRIQGTTAQGHSLPECPAANVTPIRIDLKGEMPARLDNPKTVAPLAIATALRVYLLFAGLMR